MLFKLHRLKKKLFYATIFYSESSICKIIKDSGSKTSGVFQNHVTKFALVELLS